MLSKSNLSFAHSHTHIECVLSHLIFTNCYNCYTVFYVADLKFVPSSCWPRCHLNYKQLSCCLKEIIGNTSLSSRETSASLFAPRDKHRDNKSVAGCLLEMGVLLGGDAEMRCSFVEKTWRTRILHTRMYAAAVVPCSSIWLTAQGPWQHPLQPDCRAQTQSKVLQHTRSGKWKSTGSKLRQASCWYLPQITPVRYRNMFWCLFGVGETG